jgi:CPA1 family monovalent cation:H+ antiporter
MDLMLFEIITVLLVGSAVFAYVNERYVKMPDTIGVMTIAIMASLIMYVLEVAEIVDLREPATEFLSEVEYSHTVLHGMIAFLLFSGSLNVRMAELAGQKWLIGFLAIGGTVLGTLIIGTIIYYLLQFMGMGIPYIYALLFGAMISPTDPIACLGIMKQAGMPARLQILIEGESLFNDGVGVVVFLVILGIIEGTSDASASGILALFGQQALGAIFIGTVCSIIAFFMMTGVKHTSSQVLITLALVAGCFTVAEMLHVSGLIAIVVSGLIVGNYGRFLVVSESSRHHMDTFWELVDEVLNVVLFLLIGLHMLAIPFNINVFVVAILAIPLCLLGRAISVAIPVALLRIGPRYKTKKRHIVTLLTWGGLRGGLSIAMVLSLPESEQRDLMLTMICAVVFFSIIVQGMTIGRIYTKEQLSWLAKDDTPPIAPNYGNAPTYRPGQPGQRPGSGPFGNNPPPY